MLKRSLAMLAAAMLAVTPVWAEEQETELSTWGNAPSDIPQSAPAQLAEALNAPGGTLTFAHPADEAVWPMICAEDEEENLGVTSTNVLQDASVSAITTTLEARAGDALAVTFALSGEEVFDRFCLVVNGETVKVFTGEKPRMTYAWAIPADGGYTVELRYEKDEFDHAGTDSVFIDEVALLTGDAASAALAANPAYPASGANILTLTTAGAQQLIFQDPTFALTSLFGLADYYVVGGDAADFHVTLDEAVDPEGAYIVSRYDSVSRSLIPLMTEDGYTFTTPVDSADATGYPYTVVQLYPFAGAGLTEVRTLVIFADAANADAFVARCQADGLNVNGWEMLTVSEDEYEVQE